jgi:hypothetical protein
MILRRLAYFLVAFRILKVYLSSGFQINTIMRYVEFKKLLMEQVPHPQPNPPTQPPNQPVPMPGDQPPAINKPTQPTTPDNTPDNAPDKTVKVDQAVNKLVQLGKQDPKKSDKVSSTLDQIIKWGSKLLGIQAPKTEQVQPATLDQKGVEVQKIIDLICQKLPAQCDKPITNVETFIHNAFAEIHSQGVEKGKEESTKEAQDTLNKLNDQIEQLARKVANYQDPDPGTKYTSKEKKVQANAEKAKANLKRGLFSLFFEYVYFHQELTEQEVIEFVKDCVNGNVLNMPNMIQNGNGVIDDYIKGHQKVYNTVVKKLINYKGPAVTGGAVGPAEILLSAIGSPASKGTSGDLVVAMPDGENLTVEVKAGSSDLGSGARLNGTAINSGTGALRLIKKLYVNLGIEGKDLHQYKKKPTYSISENYLATLNKKLATFNNAKLNQYVVGVLQALVNNYDEVYEKESEKIKKMIDNSIQPGTENGPIVFEEFRKVITYVQLISYELSNGVRTIMTVDTAKRTFSITGSPEEFVNQIGTRHVMAGSLGITPDPQTASFHWRSA